jgi:hypothetical protein
MENPLPTHTEEILAPIPAVRHELTVPEVVAQAEKIKAVAAQAMDDGIHYGRIPGTPKPTLLKAGAEKLCLLFRLDPEYESTETRDGDHLSVKSRCTLYHIPTGQRFGSGEGSCTSRESKYAYRKRGGDRTANLDLPDQYNTILKMANKRALVAAVLNVTAASDIFTQDLEDLEEGKTEKPEKALKPPIVPILTKPDRELERPPPAPLEEWLEAFTRPDNVKALEALWRGVTQPDLWETWSPAQQVQLTAAKNAAKKRLGLT